MSLMNVKVLETLSKGLKVRRYDLFSLRDLTSPKGIENICQAAGIL